MTDKEWLELCEWVNLLNSDKVCLETFNINERVITFIKVRTDDFGCEVYNNFAGIPMASGLTLNQAQRVFDILNRVKGR